MWYDADIDARDDAHRAPADPGRPGPARRGARLRPDARYRGGRRCSACWSTGSRRGLLAFTIFFYIVIYTMWLKRTTPQNIVIGGAAGAFPPMIGWAAATGGIGARADPPVPHHLLLDPAAFLGAVALSHRRLRQGRRADAAGRRRRRRRRAARSCSTRCALAPIGASPWLFGYAGSLYAASALAAGALMVALAWRVRTPPRAGRRAGGEAPVRLLDPLPGSVVRRAAGGQARAAHSAGPPHESEVTSWMTDPPTTGSC